MSGKKSSLKLWGGGGGTILASIIFLVGIIFLVMLKKEGFYGCNSQMCKNERRFLRRVKRNPIKMPTITSPTASGTSSDNTRNRGSDMTEDETIVGSR